MFKNKYVLIGLLLLILGAAFFLSKFNSSTSIEKPIDFTQSNNPAQEAQPSIEDMGAPVAEEVAPQNLEHLNQQDQQKFRSFIEISQSGRDNDPRIDSELRKMSSELKAELENYYKNLAPEKRNERGLVSFLIARDASTVEDLDFLKEVFSEEPCLSMADCKTLSPRDPHMAGVDEVSLSYPQLAALYQFEKHLQTNIHFLDDPAFKDQFRATLAKAAQSQVPKIREKAESLQKKYSL